MFEGEFGEDEMEEGQFDNKTDMEGGEKESELEEGEVVPSEGLSINDKLQLEIANQIELKQQELVESEAKVRELNNVPLKDNKEVIERVEEQQRLQKEQQ